MKRFNKEELVIGLIFGLLTCLWLGWLGVVIAPIIAMLWSLTGMGYSKLLRRLLAPALVCSMTYWQTGAPLAWVPLPIAFGVLSLGYGIPDVTDDGSALGRFWIAITENPLWANILTRSTIYMLLVLSYLPVILILYAND